MLDHHSERLAHRLAFTMSEDKAAWILTMADEPELLIEPGEIPPRFGPILRRAAEIVSERVVDRVLGGAQAGTIH